MFDKLPAKLLLALGLAGCGSVPVGEDPGAPKPGEVGYSQASLRIAMTGTNGGGISQGNAMGGGNGNGRGNANKNSAPVSEAIVHIDRVTAHAPGGWVELRNGPSVKVDVLRLAQSAQELGFGNLVGRVNQIRLHVDGSKPPYVTLGDGSTVPLKVPSGEQSGIKVKGLWDIAPCAAVTANLEMDGKKSIWIHPTGHGDLYILRPVIRAGGTHGDAIPGCDPDGEPLPTNDPSDPNVDPYLGPMDGVPPGTDPSGTGGDPSATGGTPTGSGPDGSGGTPTGSGGDPSATGGTPTGSGPDGSGGTLGDPDLGGPGSGYPSSDPNDPSATGGTPTGSGPDGSGTSTGGDPSGTGGDPSGTGTPSTGTPTSGTPDGSCASHGDCATGFFCTDAGFCSNL